MDGSTTAEKLNTSFRSPKAKSTSRSATETPRNSSTISKSAFRGRTAIFTKQALTKEGKSRFHHEKLCRKLYKSPVQVGN